MAEEKDFDKDAIAAEIAKQSSNGSEDDAIANAAARMEALGFDPSADEIVPDDQPVPDEDLEDIEDDDEEGDDLESEDEEDDDSTPEDDDDEPADTDDEEVDKDAEAQNGDEGKDEPQLSDAYYRAAIHSGMTEGDVKDFMKVNPELALKTFGNLYESMNRTSQEFADLGRHKKQQANKGTEEVPDEKPGFKKVDIDKLRNEYGDDKIVDVIDALQNQVATLSEQRAPVVNNSDQELVDEKTKNATEQIESFFNSADMTKYDGTYGQTSKGDVNWASLMPNAMMNRVAVIDNAEELIEGAAALGREMSIADALERAHLLVTQPIRDKIIRDDIMGNVVKRSKGITLKPSNKVAGAPAGAKGPATASEIEDNAAKRLAKVFGS